VQKGSKREIVGGVVEKARQVRGGLAPPEKWDITKDGVR